MKLLITQMIMIVMMWTIMFMFNLKKKSNVKSLSPFECGYNFSLSKMPMSIQFTLLVFVFLLFDIELSILISSNWTMNTTNKTWISTMLYFMVMLMISIIYEMTKKSFKWN